MYAWHLVAENPQQSSVNIRWMKERPMDDSKVLDLPSYGVGTSILNGSHQEVYDLLCGLVDGRAMNGIIVGDTIIIGDQKGDSFWPTVSFVAS